MNIKYLQLKGFRNFDELKLEVCNGVNIFIGDNAQGKTNILESIYYCCLAKSHRTNKDKELINWSFEEGYISIYVNTNRLDKKIEIKLFKGGKRGIRVNSIKINKLSEFIGTFTAVIFSPEDLKIVKEAPSFRRRFLDMELSQISNLYYYNLVQYNKVLEEKNTLLKKHFRSHMDMYDIYDTQLSQFGSEIIKFRLEYIKTLNEKGSKIHQDITSNEENIYLKYVNSIGETNLKEEFIKRLNENRNKDIEKGISSIGPHRDDFIILINDVDTRVYGSQGQQRTAILTIKFASIEILKDRTGEYPVLLLDDVLSELDESRQRYILKSINNVQTFITCNSIENVVNYLDRNIKIYEVKKGKVT
ncbi:MAG TPA: DNA replication/repair protein RecF [Clostridiaceae bacterium]